MESERTHGENSLIRREENVAEIVRAKAAGFSSGLASKLQESFRGDVFAVAQATLKQALLVETEVHRNELDGEKPRPSGQYHPPMPISIGIEFALARNKADVDAVWGEASGR